MVDHCSEYFIVIEGQSQCLMDFCFFVLRQHEHDKTMEYMYQPRPGYILALPLLKFLLDNLSLNSCIYPEMMSVRLKCSASLNLDIHAYENSTSLDRSIVIIYNFILFLW